MGLLLAAELVPFWGDSKWLQSWSPIALDDFCAAVKRSAKPFTAGQTGQWVRLGEVDCHFGGAKNARSARAAQLAESCGVWVRLVHRMEELFLENLQDRHGVKRRGRLIQPMNRFLQREQD